MESLLIIRNIKVENANAIAGLTYGFPSISAFLGFTHALSRKLDSGYNLTLGGCAVVCHEHQVHAHQPGGWGDYVFALTRNPLTKEGKTPAFVEEGRMNMTVSLIIECDFLGDDIELGGDSDAENIQRFEEHVSTLAVAQKLAGGTVVNIGKVEFVELDDSPQTRRTQIRKVLYRSLPGTALIDRSDVLEQHLQMLRSEDDRAEMVDAWLDFSALKQKAVPNVKEGEQPTDQHSAEWKYLPKPASGWLVPIAVGYKAVSALYENDDVARTRDTETPFRFVETAYGVGQWISPHRIQHIDDLMWRYHFEDDWYLCVNHRKTHYNHI